MKKIQETVEIMPVDNALPYNRALQTGGFLCGGRFWRGWHQERTDFFGCWAWGRYWWVSMKYCSMLMLFQGKGLFYGSPPLVAVYGKE